LAAISIQHGYSPPGGTDALTYSGFGQQAMTSFELE
jgi:hypothetical protein